jgi:esterase/lipase
MLNRASFAITLEEFAKLSSSISEAYMTLIDHPNIVLTSAQDEITKEETEEFIYVPGHDDEFVN